MASLIRSFPPSADLRHGQRWPTRISCQLKQPQLDIKQHEVSISLNQALAALKDKPNGWILFIAPPALPSKALLAARGVELKRVLIIHPHKIKNWQQTLERSLINGHCAAVFSWLPEHIAIEQPKLQYLASQRGVLAQFFTRSAQPNHRTNHGLFVPQPSYSRH